MPCYNATTCLHTHEEDSLRTLLRGLPATVANGVLGLHTTSGRCEASKGGGAQPSEGQGGLVVLNCQVECFVTDIMIDSPEKKDRGKVFDLPDTGHPATLVLQEPGHHGAKQRRPPPTCWSGRWSASKSPW